MDDRQRQALVRELKKFFPPLKTRGRIPPLAIETMKQLIRQYGPDWRELGLFEAYWVPKRELPRCGVRTRADGHPCLMRAFRVLGEPLPRNGRCRLHGGKSTGPKTPEAKAKNSLNLGRWARPGHR
jgi:hypothetical protein